MYCKSVAGILMLTLLLSISGCGSDAGSAVSSTGTDTATGVTRKGNGARQSLPSDKANFLVVLDPDTVSAKATPAPSPSPSVQIPQSQLPPVLDQGYLSSCGAFALGYAIDTIVINQAAGTSPSEKSNQSSPAYMYAVAMNVEGYTNTAADQGSGGGTYASDYFDYLVSSGSLSNELYTYPGMYSNDSPSSEKTEKGIDPILDAIINKTAPAPSSVFKIGDWGIIYPEPTSNSNQVTTFSSSNDSALFLTRVKAVIASGCPVGISVQEYNDMDNWYNKSSDSVMDPPAGDLDGGYHFMVVIGYNDTMSYTDSSGQAAQGVLRIQNSWGTDFGDGGCFWMSYNAFLNSINEAYVAYPVGNSASSDPSYVSLQDSSSSAVTIRTAPLAQITRAYQKLYTDQYGKQTVHLILHYQFGEPLRFRSIRLTGQTGSPMTISGGRISQSGYRYVSRSDGSQFKSGAYKVIFEVEDLKKQLHTLSGTVNVPALPSLPESDSKAGVLGSNGQPVQ